MTLLAVALESFAKFAEGEAHRMQLEIIKETTASAETSKGFLRTHYEHVLASEVTKAYLEKFTRKEVDLAISEGKSIRL